MGLIGIERSPSWWHVQFPPRRLAASKAAAATSEGGKSNSSHNFAPTTAMLTVIFSGVFATRRLRSAIACRSRSAATTAPASRRPAGIAKTCPGIELADRDPSPAPRWRRTGRALGGPHPVSVDRPERFAWFSWSISIRITEKAAPPRFCSARRVRTCSQNTAPAGRCSRFHPRANERVPKCRSAALRLRVQREPFRCARVPARPPHGRIFPAGSRRTRWISHPSCQ